MNYLVIFASWHWCPPNTSEEKEKKKEKRWYILKKENNEGQTSERSTYWLCLDSQFRPDHTRQSDLCHQTFEWWLVSTSLFFFQAHWLCFLGYRISVIELKLLYIVNVYRFFNCKNNKKYSCHNKVSSCITIFELTPTPKKNFGLNKAEWLNKKQIRKQYFPYLFFI